MEFNFGFTAGVVIVAIIAILLVNALFFRTVVKTTDVHVIQKGKKTLTYGGNSDSGNTYYAFPSWFPLIGVSITRLTTTNFDINIDNYESYDQDRVPFKVDIMSCFRISDFDLASKRIADMGELRNQLHNIVKGAVRSVLAKRDLNEILEAREELSREFNSACVDQLENWGVTPVKMIELMDIRDSGESSVIFNISQKKQSTIEMESRTTVANNKKQADIAETMAHKESEIKRQEANKEVGLKTVENQREVAISKELAEQAVKEQAIITAEKNMAVKRVQEVKQAEINKDVQVIQAEQDKRTIEINAEASKQAKILEAEASKQEAVLAAEALLETKTKEAEGIQRIGEAEASAREKLEVSIVAGQIQLSKEIGSNEGYQKYLIGIRAVEAQETIGKEQALALAKAELKLIVNDGSVNGGINRIGEIFSSKGGTQLGAMLEGLKQTPMGQIAIDKFFGGKGTSPAGE